MSEFVVITGLSGAGRSPGGRRPRGPRLVRHRQPAARADPQGGRAGPGARARTIERVALVVGTGPLPRRARARPRRSCAAPGPGCGSLFLDAVDRRPRPPLREHPPPPPAGRRASSAGRGHRARAGAARAGQGRGRRRRRHQRPQRPPAARTGSSSCSAATTPAAGMQTTRRCRSATSTACRSTSTSCSTAASCPTRTGSTSCGRSPASTSRCATTSCGQPATGEFLDRLDDLLDLLLPAYVAEGKSYLTIAFGLHRRPPPLGRHRRGGRPSSLAQAAGFEPTRPPPGRRAK